MRVIHVRNVREALPMGIEYLLTEGHYEDSRVGRVLVSPCPVTTVYHNSQERVLLSPIRDANPFFHLMESLWMLSGSNDARWLDYFVKDFSSRFAEEGGIQHGAYGFRWRNHFDLDAGGHPCLPDQLNTIVELLRADPKSRQAVLTMWDPVADLGAKKKDLPCNTHIYFRIRDTEEEVANFIGGYTQSKLDITVCCRSNDIVWGAYGANAVHFSVLQEYMAARIGVGIGYYYQVSNNYHIYEHILHKVKGVVREFKTTLGYNFNNYYDEGVTPIVTVPDKFDRDLMCFMGTRGGRVLRVYKLEPPITYYNSWFTNTASPLFEGYELWRSGDRLKALEGIKASKIAPDWKLAVVEWMERRMK